MYLEKLFHDTLSANAQGFVEAQHSFLYVWEGSITVNGESVPTDSAVYVEDHVALVAGADGANLLRWELAPREDPPHFLVGENATSVLRMSRQIKMFELVPTSRWLFRLDCILNAEGSTGMHAHPGSGIRCMLSTNGECRVESEKGEESISRTAGDVWYEEGSYPINSTRDPGVKTTFLRGMVFPPEFEKFHDTVIWIERPRKVEHHGDSSKFVKHYLQKIIKLR